MPEFAEMFPGIGFTVFVIRPPVRGNINVYEHSALQVTYGSKNNFIAAYRLCRFGRSNRDAIIHGFNIGPFFLLVIRLAGIRKAVYSVRGTIHYNSFLQKVIRRSVWRMAIAPGYMLIANSDYSRDVFLRYIHLDRARIKVIYNPVDSDRLQLPNVKKGGQSLDIIYVGRLAEGKNLFRWLDMAAMIHEGRNDARFYLYGDGPLKEKLIEYVHSIRAEEYVFFKGFLRDISVAYHRADLMMFLSEFESFGNVVVESILCGTPVIASDIPSLREIFRNYPQFLVPTEDRMGSAILEKINDLEKLKRHVADAALEFRTRFSTEQHSDGLNSVYTALTPQIKRADAIINKKQ